MNNLTLNFIKDLKKKMQTNIEGVCMSAPRFGANNNLACMIGDDKGKTFLLEITRGLREEYKEIYDEKKRLHFIGVQIKIQYWGNWGIGKKKVGDRRGNKRSRAKDQAVEKREDVVLRELNK